MTNIYTVTVEEDPDSGDLILPFPEELLQTMNWKEGDTLVWGNTDHGIFLTKKEDE